jgi:hypothetical protein
MGKGGATATEGYMNTTRLLQKEEFKYQAS